MEWRGANRDISHLAFPVLVGGVKKKGDIWVFKNIEVFKKPLGVGRQKMRKESRKGSQIKKRMLHVYLDRERTLLLFSPCIVGSHW